MLHELEEAIALSINVESNERGFFDGAGFGQSEQNGEMGFFLHA
jgi:hypothetical protein